ncbi:MAG: hypothetical protein R3A80_04395 [Bdellovibrionota bacterium]
MRILHVFPLLALVLLFSCTQEKGAELYLLEGACEVQVKTNVKTSDIYVDGILIGHGTASTKVPCGEKRVQVEAEGKWTVEDYKVVNSKLPLELSYKLVSIKGVKNWAMSSEFIAQLKKGQGPLNIANPKHKLIAELRAKKRNEQGYNFSAEELASIAKKAAASDSEGEAGGAIQIDPNTNFDDPKTWL